jgi:hypothetical protein
MKLNLMGLLKMRNDIFYVIFLGILLAILCVFGYVVFKGIEERVVKLESFQNQFTLEVEKISINSDEVDGKQ